MKNSGDLFGMIDGSFADIPDVLAILKEENKVALDELTKLCEDKLHFIVNLDLKEYLDPRAYDRGEENALQFVDHQGILLRTDLNLFKLRFLSNWPTPHGVMAGLVIKLIHSTGSGNGDLPSFIKSQGTWAGCRVKICTAEDVEDFEFQGC